MPITQYYTATTLDGFIADEDNSLQWLLDVPHGEEPERAPLGRRFFGGVGALAMGSTTWEWVLDHEDLLHHPERWRRRLRRPARWVFSTGSCPRSCRRATSGSSAATSRRCTPR